MKMLYVVYRVPFMFYKNQVNLSDKNKWKQLFVFVYFYQKYYNNLELTTGILFISKQQKVLCSGRFEPTLF